MSDKLPEQKQNNTEEIDLVVIFNLIGGFFLRLFKFIERIFKAIFSIIVYTIKAIIDNFKTIGITMLVAGILGYGLEKIKPQVYTSSMLVRPYFDSKYQLVTNINYYNALLANQNYKAISTVFNINEEESKNVLDFEINPGPETENERILQYDNFIKSIDSVRAQDISFEDFIENRSIYSGNLFEITAYSKNKDIFKNLETGLNNSFTNEYSISKKKKQDSLLNIQKKNILEQLAQVDSLQKIYIGVLEYESQSQATEISLGGEGFSFSKNKSDTKEYDLLNKEIELRNQLRALEERKVDEDAYFDVISSFQEVGSKYSMWYEKYSIIFPILAFILLCLLYLTNKTVKFVKNYDE